MRGFWKKMMNSDGFTLIELLAVVAILAILAGIGIPRVMSAIDLSRQETANANVALVASAAERYVLEDMINNPSAALVADVDGADFTATLKGLLETDYLETMPSEVNVVYNLVAGADDTLTITATNGTVTKTVTWAK